MVSIRLIPDKACWQTINNCGTIGISSTAVGVLARTSVTP